MPAEDKNHDPSQVEVQDPWVDISYWARLFGISVVTAYKWKKSGRIPPPHVFNRRLHRWKLSEVQRYASELNLREPAPGTSEPIRAPWDTK